jgi:hypothetical protein
MYGTKVLAQLSAEVASNGLRFTCAAAVDRDDSWATSCLQNGRDLEVA